MKPCPFCEEEIRDEAIKCRFCGEMLPGVRKGPAPRTEPVKTDLIQRVDPEALKRALSRARESGGGSSQGDPALGALTILFQGGVYAGYVVRAEGDVPTWIAAVPAVFLAFGLLALTNASKRKLGVVMTLASLAFAGLIGRALLEQQAAREAGRAETTLAEFTAERQQRQEEAELERLRRAAEENERLGLAALAEGRAAEALELLELVARVEPGRPGLDDAIAKAEARLATERASQAEALVAIARAEAGSRDCEVLPRIEQQLARATELDPSNEEARRLLTSTRGKSLACFAGNGRAEVALRVLARSPLRTLIWVRNLTPEPLPVAPSAFVLVGKSGTEYAPDALAPGVDDPLEVQTVPPGGEASGILQFQLGEDAPAKLVFADGDEGAALPVERTFP